jgi:2-C-methyl-D-erythritol 4-phosphate cytidylyltransferase
MSSFAVIIAAAGNGTRFRRSRGNQKKTYAMLGDKPIWQHSVERFAERDDVKQILVVVSPEDESWFVESNGDLLAALRVDVVAGGKERFDSVENALAKVRADIEYIAVHDGARPCLSSWLLEHTFAMARINGSAIPTVPVSSTLKRSGGGSLIEETVDRSNLYLSQTPQVFVAAELQAAFARRGDLQPTDEAQLMEMLDQPIQMVEGCPLNLKITSQQDLLFADAALTVLAKSDAEPIRFDGPIGDSNLR